MKPGRLIFAAMFLSLSACASALTPEEKAQQLSESLYADDPRRGEEVNKLCFASSIDGFSQTTKRAVVVSEGLRDYLVTTRFRCNDLDHALSLGVKSFSACLRPGDKLIGSDSAFGLNSTGPGPQTCLVDKIYEWDADAELVETADAAP